jgi:hypothetical protein
VTDQTDQPEEKGFEETAWHTMIGIQTPPGLTGAGTLHIRAVVTPTAIIPGPGDTQEPDKTIPAVHFTQWFERNKGHLVAMWEVEYAQYMNLRRMSLPLQEPGPPALALVDVEGQRLGSNDTTQ